MRKLVVAIVVVYSCCAARCFAHPATIASATATIDPAGNLSLTAHFDLLAFALNETPERVDDEAMRALLEARPEELQAALDGARDRFVNDFAVIGDDGRRAAIDGLCIAFPTEAELARRQPMRARLPVMGDVTLTGKLRHAPSSVAFQFPESLGRIVLIVERPGHEPSAEPLEPGRASATFPVSNNQRAALPEPPPLSAAVKYLRLGFTHILPHGLDHVLFVLGLFLLSASLRPLLWQVTAFTVAHSITLALALYGVVRLPGSIVEPLIALSIAFIAFENLFTSDLKPWRPLVVFGFGLVHGLGFAGVLSELGLPRSEFFTALVTFNLGVEAGQLAVIALAFLAVGWWRRTEAGRYRRWVVVPASVLIAACGAWWTITRALGI